MKLPAGHALMVAAGLWGSGLGWAGGYLASDAPPRLRYQRPKPVVANPVVLPPLALWDPAPAVSTPAEAGPQASANGASGGQSGAVLERVEGPSGTAGVAVAGGSTNGVPTLTWAGTTPLELGVAERAEIVTPQLLVPFFTDAEASRAALLVAEPVRFVPPQPAARRSSQATYTRGR
ncbi:MAG: hypothetical protein KF833_00095 [Verrucomicrobiae bacterium]|nr:hypothetical protein [Verrucomicrobiae bacterium]